MSKAALVFSAKGGVGKSIFTVALLSSLSKLKKRILIVDADLYNGGITTLLNLKPKKTIYDFSKEDPTSKFLNINNYVTKYNDYISVVCAPKNILEADDVNVTSLKDLISHSYLLYDCILVDTNHIYNKFNTSLIKSVDEVLYLITNDPLDLENSKNILDELKKSKKKVSIILNNSIKINKDYFSKYDIKSIIRNNIDYTLSNKFYLDNIDSLIAKEKLLTKLELKAGDVPAFNLIAKILTAEEKK